MKSSTLKTTANHFAFSINIGPLIGIFFARVFKKQAYSTFSTLSYSWVPSQLCRMQEYARDKLKNGTTGQPMPLHRLRSSISCLTCFEKCRMLLRPMTSFRQPPHAEWCWFLIAKSKFFCFSRPWSPASADIVHTVITSRKRESGESYTQTKQQGQLEIVAESVKTSQNMIQNMLSAMVMALRLSQHAAATFVKT